ncbi:putative efflux pump antibiotic resistance protein [Sclerotinia borealis F-4128]|uniref:Putative efflux pump antibiotic resistance protein n=1 Tax=Sclerotinia borealis (strain F-4128) TaxID=1432307 RepID=W9C665_SCLBF|nr:putative efflux pump antibiotic resistance protein [Sclerotinia borealis F-4128]
MVSPQANQTSPAGQQTQPASENQREKEGGLVYDDSNTRDTELFQQNVSQDWEFGMQEKLIVTVLVVISLFVALDAAILAPVLPTIAKDLHGSAIDVFWVGTSYLLTCAAFQPFIAATSDIFGRQWLLLISVSLFTLGTLIACLAQTIPQILAGRAIQGIGGGGVISLVLIIITDIVPLRQRPKYGSLVQIPWALGGIIGPLIGGAFAQHVTWRWIFYINFPFCAMGLVAIPFVVKMKTRRAPLRTKLRLVDWEGGFLFVASITSFLIGTTWGGVQFPWSSYQTLLPLVLGIFGILATLVWERWGARQASIRLSLFASRSGWAVYTCSVIQGLMLFSQSYYLNLWLQSVRGFSPTMSGVGQLPITISLIPSSIIVGVVMTRTGHYRWAVWAGWAMVILSSGLTIHFDHEVSQAYWIIILVLVGVGHGILLNAQIVSAQASAKSTDVAYAAAMYAFARTFGMAIGVAIGGTILQNQMQHALESFGLPTSIAQDAAGFISQLNSLPDDSQFKMEVISAYSQGFRTVFEVLTAISGAGGLISLAIGSYSLDRQLDSEHVLNTS